MMTPERKKLDKKSLVADVRYDVSISAIKTSRDDCKNPEGKPNYSKGGFLFAPGLLSIDFLYDLFYLVKQETDVLATGFHKTLFKKISSVIWSSFSTKIKQKGDVEDDIVEYIEALKKRRFNLNVGKTDGYDYQYSLDEVLEQIKEGLISLRQQRIEFWKLALQEYKKNKKKFI